MSQDDQDVERELKAAAMARADAAGATYRKNWDAARIEAAALAAEQALKSADDEEARKRADVMKQAHALGMDLEELKGRPIDDVLSMIAKHSSETALARNHERRTILQEAAKLGFDVGSQDFQRMSNEEILAKLADAYGERARRLTAAEARPMGKVRVRVLKAGHDRISKGVHIPGMGDLKYAHGDEVTLPRGSAQALEDRGFVEIFEA